MPLASETLTVAASQEITPETSAMAILDDETGGNAQLDEGFILDEAWTNLYDEAGPDPNAMDLSLFA